MRWGLGNGTDGMDGRYGAMELRGQGRSQMEFGNEGNGKWSLGTREFGREGRGEMKDADL